jgi:hypothetical protein
MFLFRGSTQLQHTSRASLPDSSLDEQRRHDREHHPSHGQSFRRPIAFVIEASEAISLMIRPQLDQANLLVAAPSIRVKRCAVVGTSAVCEAVDMPVRLHAHWTYNGLYEIQIGRTRTRDASSFQSDATNQVLHMATVDYEFALNGEAIPIAGVSGSIGWSSEAQITFTTPAGVPVTALPQC